jgi:rod shape-determining protein MreD
MEGPGFYEPPSRTRLWAIPIGSTILASALTALPLVSQFQLFPPFGLMLALAWRLRRPEMWPAWIALPLGLADDLFSGAAIGSAMTLWTIAFLAIDAADSKPTWRDYWLDWRIAAGILLICGFGQWALAVFTGGGGVLWPALPPIVFAILLFPAAARFCALLDRWRLAL